MSAFPVTFSKLRCDAVGCGVVYDNIGTPVSHLRELAAKDGWRHRSERAGTSNWLRAVDLCPAARLPTAASRARARRA